MKKINIDIAIPTFNRVEKLKVALQSIEAQIIDSSVELHCVISNTASTDETGIFLDNLKSNEKITYHILNKMEVNEWLNWLRCIEFIPTDIDWVWFHGDDDYFSKNDAIQIIADQIKNPLNVNVTLIHACQSRRSRNTGIIHNGNLLELCNAIGYHEMLGWMSSLVVKRDKFVNGLIKYLKKTEEIKIIEDAVTLKMSAFTHSAALLEACINDDALFVDIPLIEPQDLEQDELSIKRWEKDNAGLRYYFVIDDLLDLKERDIIKNNLSPTFFRYLNFSIWDRFLADIIASVINIGFINDIARENLQRIKKISTLIGNPYDKKIFTQHYHSIEEALENYELSMKVMKIKTKQLEGHHALTRTESYPFKVLGNGGYLIG
jgi:glycosyltransferase involved in cell wall biosynthesis